VIAVLRVSPFLVFSAAVACAPVSVSHIGPRLAPREEKCAVEVLDKGETPGRPYRDIGLVTVETCEDYRMPPCRTWIVEEACKMGGQIAYVEESARPNAPTVAPLRARVLIAAYVSDLRPDPETDPLLRSRTCEPACGAGMRCVNRECVPSGDADCAAKELKTPEKTEASQPSEKCLE